MLCTFKLVIYWIHVPLIHLKHYCLSEKFEVFFPSVIGESTPLGTHFQPTFSKNDI